MRLLVTITIFFIYLFHSHAFAQAGLSRITLKNGTEIKGVVKSIDPSGYIVISLSGNEVSFKMTDVAKIDGIAEESENEESMDNDFSTKYREKIIVTDLSDYPDSFDLKIGSESLKMILIRGGDLNMGYDKDHSVVMKSEPIHKIGITSFYISETVVTNAFVSALEGNKVKKGLYDVDEWKYANEVANSVAKKLKMMVRLPTEAEWEYAACSQEKDRLFANTNHYEYCSDLYDRFQDVDYKVDPTGPQHSIFNCHVVRSYNLRHGVYDRSGYSTKKERKYFRLVIKAKDVSK